MDWKIQALQNKLCTIDDVGPETHNGFKVQTDLLPKAKSFLFKVFSRFDSFEGKNVKNAENLRAKKRFKNY